MSGAQANQPLQSGSHPHHKPSHQHQRSYLDQKSWLPNREPNLIWPNHGREQTWNNAPPCPATGAPIHQKRTTPRHHKAAHYPMYPYPSSSTHRHTPPHPYTLNTPQLSFCRESFQTHGRATHNKHTSTSYCRELFPSCKHMEEPSIHADPT